MYAFRYNYIFIYYVYLYIAQVFEGDSYDSDSTNHSCMAYSSELPYFNNSELPLTVVRVLLLSSSLVWISADHLVSSRVRAVLAARNREYWSFN